MNELKNSIYSLRRERKLLHKLSITEYEERFNQNLLRFPENPCLLQYRDNPLIYIKNDEGFRTPDNFNTNEAGNVFLGCSHTWGEGHYLENLWSYKMNEYVGGKFFNMGMAGLGAQHAFLVLNYYIDKLNVKNVFAFLPHKFRYAYYNENWRVFNATQVKNPDQIDRDSFEASLMRDETANLMYYTSLTSIALLCKEKNINFYFLNKDLTDFKKLINFEYKHENGIGVNGVKIARDMNHLPVKWQNAIFKEFKKLYDSNETFHSSRCDLRASRGVRRLIRKTLF